MLRVLITGITGFLGSHIAGSLCQNGFSVTGLKRAHSDIWRCSDFAEKIDWVDIDELGDWKKSVGAAKPDLVIHCAWIGVEAIDREDWGTQVRNINFLVDLLEVCKQSKSSKFIFLGSQAEYGFIEGRITEEFVPKSVTAYGSTKLASLEICKTFCELNNINWIWLRLFSLFGEKENSNWLIPSVISKMQTGTAMDFTAGEQKYAYMYVKDFAEIILKLVVNEVVSGVYNVSSNKAEQLKTIIEQIREVVNPGFTLNFGAISYRAYQSMHIEGDISKLITQIGNIEFTDFKLALRNTIQHYTSK